MIPPKARLVIAAVLFLGWMGLLGYTAWSKSRGPVVSKAQAAAAAVPVVAEVTAGPDGKPAAVVKVVEPLRQNGPAAGTELVVANLAEAAGFGGPDRYLLLLAAEPGGRPASKDKDPRQYFLVVGTPRSPGYDLAGTGTPTLYRWTPDVQAQARKLYP